MKFHTLKLCIFVICFSAYGLCNFLKSSNAQISGQKLVKANCYVQVQGKIFDLNPINEVLTMKSKDGKDITFSMCFTPDLKCNTHALVIEPKSCTAFSGPWSEDKTWNLDTTSQSEHIYLYLPKGSECQQGGGLVGVTYDITCDPKTDMKILNMKDFDTNKCTNIIKMKSKYACSVENFRKWYSFIPISMYIIAGTMAIIGVLILIFLGPIYKVLSGLIITLGFGLIVHGVLLSLGADLNILICIFIAFLFVILMLDCILLLLEIAIGYIIGSFIFDLLVKYSWINSNIFFWILVILVIIIFITIGDKMGELLKKFCTAFLGSFLLIRSIGIICDNYPDEVYLSNLVRHQEFNQIGRLVGGGFLAYFGIILVISIVFTVLNRADTVDNNTNSKPPSTS